MSSILPFKNCSKMPRISSPQLNPWEIIWKKTESTKMFTVALFTGVPNL